MSDIKFDILQPAGPQTEQETELDIAMKPYLNSGQYTKKELEQIRKRLANDIEEGKRKSAVEKEKKEKEKKKQDVVDIFTKDLPGKVKPYMKNVSDVQTTGVDLIDAVLVPTQVGANILGTAVDEYSRASRREKKIQNNINSIGNDNVIAVEDELNINISDNHKVDIYSTDGVAIVIDEDKEREGHFSQPKLIEIREDGTVRNITDSELRNRDPEFYNKYNKEKKEKYLENFNDSVSYFDDFDATEDKFEEDVVVEELNHQLKKYGIQAKIKTGSAFTDYIVLFDDRGNEQSVNLGLMKNAYVTGPDGGKKWQGLVPNDAANIQNDIKDFVNKYGTKYEDSGLYLNFSENLIEKAEKKAKLLEKEPSVDYRQYNIYKDLDGGFVSDKKELLKNYNALETDEEKEKFLIENGYSTEKINVREYAIKNNIKDAALMADEEVTELELQTMRMLNYGLSNEEIELLDAAVIVEEQTSLYSDIDIAMKNMKDGTDKRRNLLGEVYDIDETIDITNDNVNAWLIEYFLKPENREVLTRIKQGGGFDNNVSIKEQLIQQAENEVISKGIADLDIEKKKLDIDVKNLEDKKLAFENKIEKFNEDQTKLVGQLTPLKDELDRLESEATLAKSYIESLVEDINSFDTENMSSSDYEVYKGLVEKYNNAYSKLESLQSDYDFQRKQYNTLVESDEMKDLLARSVELNEDQENFAKYADELNEKGTNLSEKYDTLFTSLGYNAATGTWDTNFKATQALIDYNNKYAESSFGNNLQTFTSTVTDGLADLVLHIPAFAVTIGTTGVEWFIEENDPTKYQYVNVVDDYMEDFIGANMFAPMAPRTEGIAEAGFTWQNVSRTTGELLPFTAGLIAAVRSGNPSAAKNAFKLFNPKKLTQAQMMKIHQRKAMLTYTTAVLMYPSLKEAEELGLKDGEKWAFASASVLATGLSQMVMPDTNFLAGTAGKAWKNALADGLRGTVNKEAGKQIVKTSLKNFTKEFAEEEIDFAAQEANKLAFGLSNTIGWKDIEAHADLFVGTLFLTSSIQQVSNYKTYKAIEAKVFNEFDMRGAQTITNIQTQQAAVKDKLSRYKKLKNPPAGVIEAHEKTLEQLNKAELQARAMLHAKNTAPKNASFEHLKLLSEKFKLVESKKGETDKGKLDDINKQIKDIDTELESTAAHDQYLEDQKKDVEDTKKKSKAKYEANQEQIEKDDKEIADLEARIDNYVLYTQSKGEKGTPPPEGFDLVFALDQVDKLKERRERLDGEIEVYETQTDEEAAEIIETSLNEKKEALNKKIEEAAKPENRNKEGGEIKLIKLRQDRAALDKQIQDIRSLSEEKEDDVQITRIDNIISRLDPDTDQEQIISLTKERDELQNKLNKSYGWQGFTSFGFTWEDVNGNRQIIINKQRSLQSGFITTGQHEFLHAVLNDAIGTQLQEDLAVPLAEFITSNKNISRGGEMFRRLTSYASDEKAMLKEVMPLLSEALSRKDIVANEGFLGKMGDVFRQTLQRYGLKDIKFNTGQDIFNFIKDYNQTIGSRKENKAFKKFMSRGATGDLVKRAVNRTEGIQFSRTIRDTFKKYPDMKKDFDELTQNPDGSKRWNSKQEFRDSPEFWDGYLQIESHKGLEALIRFGVSSATGISTKEEMDAFVEEAKLNLLKRYEKNFNASMANGSLFGWLTGGSGEYTNSTLYRAKGDVMVKYGKKVITTGTPVDEMTDIASEEDTKTFDEQDQTQDKPVISKKDKIRKLRSLSTVYKALTPIDLNNKIQALIRLNPKNLEEQLTKLIEKEVTKAIQEQMGSISFIDGEVVVSEEYVEYFAVNYENIVQGLDVATIKKNYNTLFDLEIIGKEDRKTKKEDKPSLKKDSNYRKGIYQITTNKARFTKFFIDTSSLGRDGKPLAPQSHYNKIRDRQKKLAILIAQSVTEKVINNTIAENSTSMNAVAEAKIREYVSSLNKQKREVQGNYNDILQYSKNGERDARKLKALVRDNGFLNIFNDDGSLKSKWKKELKLPNNTSAPDFIYSLGKQGLLEDLTNLEFLPKLYHKMYKAGKRGTAFENSIIDTIISLEKEFGQDNVYAALRKPSEADGLPDVVLRLKNKLFNIEAKMAQAQYSSVTFAVDKNTGKFSIKKDYSFNERLLKELGDAAQEGIELAKARLALEIDPKTGKSFKWKNLSLLPTNLYHILTSEKINFRGKEQSYLSAMNPTIDFDLDGISEIYNNKKHPVNYIHLMGRGLFYMGGFNNETNILGTPEFKGMGEIKLRVVSNSQKRKVDGVDVKTGNTILSWRAIPTIPNGTLNALTPHEKSLDDAQGIRNIINSPEGQLLIQQSKAADARTVSNAISFSRTVNPSRGITVLDFDDTLATTKSLVKYTTPDGKTGTLNAEQFANTYEDLQDQGYVFDFSDFNKVVKGKLAPLFQKALKLQNKFGPENMFVLTARPPQAQKAIFDFLKANGLNIPLKNITGLGNSTSEAKALWVADKVAEGYNDFYFADDALQNVQAVKNMLAQFDVKSKVQQAKLQFSRGMSKEFNNLLERTTGIKSYKEFSQVQARIRGRKSKYKSLIPPSAQDFMGLMYNFIGKGKQGDKDMAFFKKALVDPFARGINELNAAKQNSFNDLNNLLKKYKGIKKRLRKKIPKTQFTQDQAVRVYLWNKYGFEIPGISKRDLDILTSFVEGDVELKRFAGELSLISKKAEGYIGPNEYWITENIQSDILSDGSIGDARSIHLAEWVQNKNIIFSPENLNKIEAIYGSKFREALEDILYRMETGSNRPRGANRLTNAYMNWVNNSVGAIMFFNIRSAVLQTISATNYINWTDNNPLKAGLALANQRQFWKDFLYIFNSDMLKQRRKGNQRGVNEAELMKAVVGSDNPIKAAIAYLLNKGFLPTQIADSFAISSGGATFYRNRINTYKKQGMSQKEAEDKAWLDFQEITEVSQQSARPDLISQQQANPLGRLILAFQNTPMQYGRIMNKAIRDLVNRRGDTKTHVSKLVYYGAIQAILFNALQSAIWASLGDEDEEEFDKKKQRILNGIIEGWLSAFGYGGKAIGTLKRSAEEYIKQRDKGWTGDHAYTLLALLGFSPPIGSKLRKIYSAINTEKFNRDIMLERGFTLDNPIWQAIGYTIEGITNIPLGALSQDLYNLDNAMDSNNEWWQRLALVMGWNTWDLGIKDPDLETLKLKIKEQKQQEKKIEKEEKKKEKERVKEVKEVNQVEHNKRLQEKERNQGKKDIKCAAVNKSGKRCGKKVEGGNTFCTIHEEVKQRGDGKKVQCKKIKSDKKRCKMKTSSESGYCYYHD